MASRDPCTSGLRTSSHSARCEWWLMASSPVRHPWTLGYPRALCLAPCCSCAISTIFPVLSDHKCASSQMTVFSTGRFTLTKTTPSCTEQDLPCSSWRYGRPGDVWGMKFNATKCYIMSLRSKSSHLYSLENQILKQVPLIPYLGVQLSDENLSWFEHISTITKKANSCLGLLRRNLRSCPEESVQKNSLSGSGQVSSWIPWQHCGGLGSIPTERHRQAGRCSAPRGRPFY